MSDRLFRSRDDRMLAGVAGGLAEMWDADPSLVRLVWALLVIFTGGIALVVYLIAVSRLDPIVRWLWPIPVALFVVYPYLKRVTWLCHLWLGVCTGLAPTGAWIATTGHAPWEAWVLGLAQGVWVAGFDLFYSLFDVEIRRQDPAPAGPAPRALPTVADLAAEATGIDWPALIDRCIAYEYDSWDKTKG